MTKTYFPLLGDDRVLTEVRDYHGDEMRVVLSQRLDQVILEGADDDDGSGFLLIFSNKESVRKVRDALNEFLGEG